jgi:hypothetical protein
VEGPDAVALTVTLPDGPLAFGVAVDLVVTLTWDASLVPAPWDDAALAPLAVALKSVERRSVGDAIEETRRYDATPFTLERVRLDALRFVAVARDGRGERSVHAEAVERTVVGEVDPAAPGALEWPAGFGPVALDEPTTPRHGTGLVVGSVTLLLLAAFGFVAWRRSRAVRRGTSGGAATPRARLLALADESAAGRTACARVADEARALLADEFEWPALARCREELETIATGAGGAALPAAARAALAALLARADVAKFARDEPTADAAAALRADARALLAALPEKST